MIDAHGNDAIGKLTPEQIARTRTFIESCLRRKLRRQLVEQAQQAVHDADAA
jgi:hypothetical protein